MKLNNPLDWLFNFFDNLADISWRGGWYLWVALFLVIILVWILFFAK